MVPPDLQTKEAKFQPQLRCGIFFAVLSKMEQIMLEKIVFKNILWAIDPLAKDKLPQESAAHALQSFSKSLSFAVQPVSVILEDQIPYLVGPNFSLADFKSQIEKKIDPWVAQLKIPSIAPTKLIVEKEFSIKRGVQTLLKFASDNHFDLIVASTHAKKLNGGPELGTFAETLFLHSNIPLLLISPKSKVPPQYKEILFPTDLSIPSLETLYLIEALALELKAHVTLFHKIRSFARDIVEFPYSADARSNYLEQLQYDQQGELERIVIHLKEHGIPANFIIDRIEADYVSKSISQRAERTKECFIAMVSHTGADKLTLPGSITRQVIRSTHVPVLVIHPEAASSRTKNIRSKNDAD